MTSEDGDTFIDKVQFYDGLGRPIETIRRRANPSGFNLVTYQEYDTYGRESNNWLSRVGTDGSSNFIPFSQFKDLSSDVYDDETAVYSKIVYEESPLNRIVEQYGAGKDWHINHRCVQTDLMTNILGNDTLNCALFKVENEWENDTILTLKREGNYNSCQLFVTRVRDEDKNQIFEFKDKLGRLILRRQFIDHESSDTYYIYNALGLPLIVIPPKASDLLMKDTKNTWISKNDTILQRYVYLYKYLPSREQLCRAMKFPGCAWTFYMYDLNNRCIFIQDANMRMRGEWQFTLPDISGRTCVVGTCCNRMNALQEEQLTSKSLIAVRRDDNAEFGYSFVNHDISLMSPTVISVNYYDDYSFTYLPNFDYADFGFNSDPGFDNIFAENVVGLQTGSLSSIISNGLTVLNYIPMIVYYDCRGRLIQSRYGNHLSNGLEEEYTAYNFVGQPTKRKHVHSATGKATQTEIYSYVYDHAGRLLTTTHQLNDGSPVVLVSNEYDELGRLKSNNRNGNPNLRTDYTYNVRSWVKSIACPLFNESLYYNDRRSNGTNVSCYNGNISGIDWNVSGDKARGYNFSYDNLSRLTGASYLEGNTSSDKFSTSYSYDKHGNMLNLTRHGNIGTTTYGVIDDLIMSYDGNQLVSVEDKGANPSLSMSMDFKDGSHESVEYAYDSNGNMVKDLNKGISMIEYNSLNLPRRVSFTGLNNPVNEYVYSAESFCSF